MGCGFTNWDAGLHTVDPNSLQHYGVTGMKWGQRRYQNSDGSLTSAGKDHYAKTGEYGYTYRSHATKKYNKKADKQVKKALESYKGLMKKQQKKGKLSEKEINKVLNKKDKHLAKAKKFENRAKRSAELDRREQDYAQRVRTGGNLLARYLTGGIVGGKAYQQHLAMNKDTKTVGSKVTAAGMSYVFGRAGSAIRKANYIRQDEKGVDRGEKFRQKSAEARKRLEDSVNNVEDLLKKKRKNG